jgi:CheY-like chemotaxis protein
MNLALNAIDALKGQPGDVIISAYSRSIPDQQPTHLVMHDHLARGDYAVLEIKDTGEGIPQSDLNRIFDPFFTTKATGRGLGLAAALGSIRALMGGIEVESTLGQGTSFRVWLPAAHADQPAPDQDAAASPDPGLSRDKSVLIIDDEPTINRMLARYCRSQGMQVFQLYNGVEAAEACRHHQPDVAIIDYSMPDVQGDELAAALRQVDPALPIILISGYSVEHMDATLDMDLFQGFLQKPFDFDTLEKTLAKLLKRDDDPSGG